MKRKHREPKRHRPEAPRQEPRARELEAEDFKASFPEDSWLRLRPF